MLQYSQVSIKASADVLPSSGEHRKFHSDSDCNAAKEKRAGTSTFGTGRTINRRGSSSLVPHLPLSLNPTFSIVCVC